MDFNAHQTKMKQLQDDYNTPNYPAKDFQLNRETGLPANLDVAFERVTPTSVGHNKVQREVMGHRQAGLHVKFNG